jgi:hypothetical protein
MIRSVLPPPRLPPSRCMRGTPRPRRACPDEAGPHAAAAKAPAAKPVPRQINWDELVPRNWDPMKELQGPDLSGLSDADPRATEMLKKMREVWDNAPGNPALVGQAVRIPGYVVPLEDSKDG